VKARWSTGDGRPKGLDELVRQALGGARGQRRCRRQLRAALTATVAIATTASLTCVALPAHAARARSRVTHCAPARSHLVAADAQAQVYRRPEASPGQQLNGFWGCVYGKRRSFLLGLAARECSASGCTALERVTLTRTVVAYETYWSAGREAVIKWHVVVLDLRSGRVLHRVPTAPVNPRHSDYVGAGAVAAIALKDDGAVAWINDTVQHENRYQVHALDKNGERVLATGSDIAPGSLALAGSTLYWTQGGKPFSATLN
jgi:hypothetical protein